MYLHAHIQISTYVYNDVFVLNVEHTFESRLSAQTFITCQIIIACQMPRRKLSPAILGSHKRQLSDAQLVAGSVGHKAQMAATLTQLHHSGTLTSAVTTERSIRSRLTDAAVAHGRSHTPYGPVVKFTKLPGEELEVEYVCPFAYLFYMCLMSDAFKDSMETLSRSDTPLRIVLYADSICPGNPFRPEKSRTVTCIYWTIVDWPAWMLQRSGLWPVLAFIRDSVVAQVNGGLSNIMGHMLRLMFLPEAGEPSFVTGIVMPGGFTIHGKFIGFLADLAAHKDIFQFKGAAGFKCCFECQNVIKHKVVDSACGKFVGLGCSDPTRFERYEDSDVFFIADELLRVSSSVSLAKFEDLQKDLGFRYTPSGLLSQQSIRQIVHPSRHCIRDWMHTIVGDGIANSEIAMLIHAMSHIGISRAQVQTFSTRCVLPKAHGKVHKNWMGESRLKKLTISSFSSIVLSLLPILLLFPVEFDITRHMPNHASCFQKLCWIVDLLSTGPERAMAYTSTLRTLLQDHHEQFWLLYATGIKPKIHHAHHIVDGMEQLGKCLSCFVTERKHKVVKRSAMYVFRHFEHTVTSNVLTSQIETIRSGNDLFREKFLVRPKDVSIIGHTLLNSKIAVTHLGELHADDIVFSSNGIAGRIISFWSQEHRVNDILLEIDAYETIDGNPALRDERKSRRMFIDLSDIVAPCVWLYVSASVIRLSVPAAALF